MSEIEAKVLNQLLFYFSPSNLQRDKYFAQKIKESPDSSLSIDDILNCNKIKSLDQDKESIIKLVQHSKHFELTDDKQSIICTKKFSIPKVSSEFRTIFVGGLPRVYSETYPDKDFFTSWLKENFAEFGKILSINIPEFGLTKTPRGLAFIEFKKEESVQNSINHFMAKYFYQATHDQGAIPEAAFTARKCLDVKMSDSLLLERKFVWRHSTKKNSQIVKTFQRLVNAGYNKPNPMRHEYSRIVGFIKDKVKAENDESCENVEKQEELFILENLVVLSQPVWFKWNQLFYSWQKSWHERFLNKIQVLSRNVEKVDQTSIVSSSNQSPKPKCMKFDHMDFAEEEFKNILQDDTKKIRSDKLKFIEVVGFIENDKRTNFNLTCKKLINNFKTQVISRITGFKHFLTEPDLPLLQALRPDNFSQFYLGSNTGLVAFIGYECDVEVDLALIRTAFSEIFSSHMGNFEMRSIDKAEEIQALILHLDQIRERKINRRKKKAKGHLSES